MEGATKTFVCCDEIQEIGFLASSFSISSVKLILSLISSSSISFTFLGVLSSSILSNSGFKIILGVGDLSPLSQNFVLFVAPGDLLKSSANSTSSSITIGLVLES